MNLQPRLYASQRIQKPPFKKTGEIAASDNKRMASNQNDARSNTVSESLNVRLCPFLKLPIGVLVKGSRRQSNRGGLWSVGASFDRFVVALDNSSALFYKPPRIYRIPDGHGTSASHLPDTDGRRVQESRGKPRPLFRLCIEDCARSSSGTGTVRNP